jgi:arsenate reductase (glutaredoxin)
MIVIFGTKSNKITAKAQRFFKERNVKVQFLDLSERGLSAGEIDNCARAVGGTGTMIDTDSAAYKKRGLAHMEFDIREELMNDPALLRMPIVRREKMYALGDDEAAWKQMAALEKP